MRFLAILLIITGGMMVAYNGVQWWDQLKIAATDPQLAVSIANNWDERTREPSLTRGISSPLDPQRGEEIGKLYVPRIGVVVPIIYGTGDDELAQGVGQYIGYGTVLPGETGHTVLAGHRETAFRRAGELKDGDKFYVKTKDRVFTYQIRKTFIVDDDNRSVIVGHDQPDASLITCYPFDMVGSAPQRYIIRADLVDIKNR
ncbi:MAG: sortase [Firmicutes bacterium]|uniref:sortase n=1 Tax=Melghirimyces thermohalophilus TaxID=1236220 RepID=UPI001FDEB9C0|nr:sortase [Melghirimyces thermohalophilus]MDA8353413.1 sortase [Bacillota bacterium]